MTKERMICEKSHREINHPEHGEITEIWWCPVEPAPPKDWKEQMYELELRNARLSRFILDWLGRELDIQNEGGIISITDLLPFRK